MELSASRIDVHYIAHLNLRRIDCTKNSASWPSTRGRANASYTLLRDVNIVQRYKYEIEKNVVTT